MESKVAVEEASLKQLVNGGSQKKAGLNSQSKQLVEWASQKCPPKVPN